MFVHLPRKLRRKNNRNVNVFCDTRFWEQGLMKLLYRTQARAFWKPTSVRSFNRCKNRTVFRKLWWGPRTGDR